MTIGSTISYHRKRMGITQEALSQKLGVTNQAVSKWELDQACPDIQLLPVLADIFGISIDALFGREQTAQDKGQPKKGSFGIFSDDLFDDLFAREVPGMDPKGLWPEDNTLRVVVYRGQELLGHVPASENAVFTYEGPAINIVSAISVTCGDIEGSVSAGGKVSCGNVGGSVDAGSEVNCGDVAGNADAGSNICCGDVGGDVDAGSYVMCGKVEGSVSAGGKVTIQN